jgi:transposase
MSDVVIAGIRRRFLLVGRSLGERARRHWVGAEAEAIGRGGVAWVASATGMAISTVRSGRDELRRLAAAPKDALETGRQRRPGGGRKRLNESDPRLLEKLKELVSASSRGDPESPLQWTTQSLRRLSKALGAAKHPASRSTVRSLLHELGFSLQSNAKVKEGTSHPDRDAQFQLINDTAKQFLSRGLPVISVDAKKKEFLGQRASPGREWAPKGEPVEVLSHDFVSDKDPVAIPYGIYDVGRNLGFVNVGADHNTPTFAARSIARWWRKMGRRRYPDAEALFITADAGGSNSPNCHVFKVELQKLADKTGLTIHMSHYPPGTSKWNKIEHRLFSVITMNWRGRPLTSYEVIVSLIGNARTDTGLRVVAELDSSRFPLGVTVSKQDVAALSLYRHAFHGEWNYTLKPRTAEERRAAAAQPRPADVISHQARRTRWRELIRQHIRSGLSAKDFCSREKVGYGGFKYARRCLVGVRSIEDKRRTWNETFEQQRKSGLSAAAFCRKHHIKYGTFRTTHRRMIQRTRGSEE